MRIDKTRKIGFCQGVRRAYDMVRENRKFFKPPVYILGDLVHNTYVIQEVKNWGIKRVGDLSETGYEGTMIITAHGVSPDIIEKIKTKGLEVVDATCPRVTFVIQKAVELFNQDRILLVFGNKEHKEVKAINGAIENKGFVFAELKEIFQNFSQADLRRKKFGLISQTTRNIDKFKSISEILKKKIRDLEIQDTICPATYERQKEISMKAAQYDLVLVIGSEISQNTKELFKIGKGLNSNVYLIDNERELKDEWFLGGIDSILICAGASMPDAVINRVFEQIKKKLK
ncbi:MAG: 4-hydroxy-3-methylbut-2-enyl diphosphate reductase [Candidatus Moranbacteria bacterium]|nr:4-hydroxy-3-methylbut-2-enyl diphosphate reductase [Candidatus Moranbacteria bacterium]